MKILIANIGSTSFKYRLVDIRAGATGRSPLLAGGWIERIGQTGAECPTYEAAIERCLGEIVGTGRPLAGLADLDAVGFKAVHAGPLSGARRVDEAVLSAMDEFSFFAPAHNPPYLAAMRAFQKTVPSVPLVALFETAFFDQLDEATTTYAVPQAWRQEHGVRRYGFHGASHRAASERAQAILGRTDLRHISCHLGGSSSLAAIRNGVAVDTSFGISPQSGLPQNNRVGDIDSFAVLYMMEKLGLDADGMARVLASECGLAGLSGGKGDVRDIAQAAQAGDRGARLALDVFVHSVRHYLGAFLVKLGGLDVVTFSGGIGENVPALRAAVCSDLAALGIEIDAGRNASLAGEGRISSDRSRVAVWVVPADEEGVVAHAVATVLEGARPAPRLAGPAV
jgi:acetate kinase